MFKTNPTTTETMFDHFYKDKPSSLDAAYERSAIHAGLVNADDAKFHENRTFSEPKWIPNSTTQERHEILKARVNDIQYGGDHYKKYGDLQPWDVITRWKLGYLDGTALKYIARWKDKGGVEDLKKAIHFLQKTIEVEESKKPNPKYETK